jgi:uncharacterized protein YegP (UPF0339 family)
MREDGFELRKAKDGKFYFVQKAKNGEILTTSETYERLQGAVDGAFAAGANPEEGALELVRDFDD